MVDALRNCDVLVVGGGNAALCAALSARRAGASVALLESAPRTMRGGNARHSRNLRVMHDAPTRFVPDRYGVDDWWYDLRRVTGEETDKALAHALIRDSSGIVDWLTAHGARFQLPSGGVLPYSRKTAFFLGGGKALVNALYATAERLGVTILYDTEVVDLDIGGESGPTVIVQHQEKQQKIATLAVVIASGGFQGDRDGLREQWGEAADHFVVRGTPYATGRPLRALLSLGAQPVGDPGWCHMVAVDGRAPPADGGILTRLDGVPHGIVVDGTGRRFADEGADSGPTRYAAWGDRLARLPRKNVFAVFDAVIEQRFAPSVYPAIQAGSIGGLADRLGIDPVELESTVNGFNAALHPGAGPDGGHTEGLLPDKSRLATPIAVPPFGAYPMRAGITATNLGVRIDERARVLTGDGHPLGGLFAAGVIMAPNILKRGYLAGAAMTIGAVFGRIAGREAAGYALH